MPVSQNVADGEDALSSQYNNLRTDVFDETSGHAHEGTSGGGKKVNHGDLVDNAAIVNTYLTHAIISKHVQGGGMSADPDATGGAEGVHGLASGVKVAGSLASAQPVFDFGQVTMGAGTGTVTAAVVFNGQFATVPIVLATFAQAPTDIGNPDEADALWVQDITVNGCNIKTHSGEEWASKLVTWLAIGTK